MPARKRAREAKRALARREEATLTPVDEAEAAWEVYEIGMAAIRFGHCSCGMGRCCRCGGYGVDGPYCGD